VPVPLASRRVQLDHWIPRTRKLPSAQVMITLLGLNFPLLQL